jgi:hypothetical protein
MYRVDRETSVKCSSWPPKTHLTCSVSTIAQISVTAGNHGHSNCSHLTVCKSSQIMKCDNFLWKSTCTIFRNTLGLTYLHCGECVDVLNKVVTCEFHTHLEKARVTPAPCHWDCAATLHTSQSSYRRATIRFQRSSVQQPRKYAESS